MASAKDLEARAKKLAAKFAEDCQALFDSPDMNDAVYEGEVMQALVMAQSWANDVAEAGK